MVEAKTTTIKSDYTNQLLKSDVFQHVVDLLDSDLRLEVRKLNKKIAASTVANMFTDASQGRLKIDMDVSHSDKSHPIFLRMKNVTYL